MSRLIDADAMKQHYPIMENDFGMVFNENLHKELDKEPTVKAIPIEVMEQIRAEVKQLPNANPSYWNSCDVVERADVLELIDETIKEQTNEL